MKLLYLGLICLWSFTACKSEQKEIIIEEATKELTIAERIANAHGYKNWKNVKDVWFTFKVDRDTIKGKGRTWRWNTKTNKVWSLIANDSVSFYRKEIDSASINLDKMFTNDKFWLLIPFQLVWDTTATISEPEKAQSPIKKESLNMITVNYPNKGGYTPGDAYDIYFDDKYLIKEWTYRQGNSEEPSLSNTFENYQDFNGIKIAIDHKKDDGKWNLNFADVSITLDK
jgi:hypothetical protein